MQKIKEKLGNFKLGAPQRKFLYLTFFFSLTPATILLSLLAFNLLNTDKTTSNIQHLTFEPYLQAQGSDFKAVQSPKFGAQVYASLPATTGQVKGVATVADARYEIIKQYLEKYNSPLVPQAQFLVDTAEKYDLDFRLLVAIAQQESNLCKKIPEGSHNCWGWGIHSRGTLGFQSYEEAIEAVAKGLREEYLDKGYTTPEEIMSKYTPSSPGSWAAGVRQFLAEME